MCVLVTLYESRHCDAYHKEFNLNLISVQSWKYQVKPVTSALAPVRAEGKNRTFFSGLFYNLCIYTKVRVFASRYIIPALLL